MSASISLLATKDASSNASAETNKSSQPEMAIVSSLDSLSRVKSINLMANGSKQFVSAQAKHIAKSAVGELVLVQQTAQGWVVTAQLAGENDAPAAHISDKNGHVRVEGAKSVTLSTAKGSIEVHENGNIVLEAAEISAASERDFSIAGWPIRIN